MLSETLLRATRPVAQFDGLALEVADPAGAAAFGRVALGGRLRADDDGQAGATSSAWRPAGEPGDRAPTAAWGRAQIRRVRSVAAAPARSVPASTARRQRLR